MNTEMQQLLAEYEANPEDRVPVTIIGPQVYIVYENNCKRRYRNAMICRYLNQPESAISQCHCGVKISPH